MARVSGQPLEIGAWHLAFLIVVAVISARGVGRGIEVATKVRAPVLLILLLVLLKEPGEVRLIPVVVSHRDSHLSIGASTGVFALLGAQVACDWMRRGRIRLHPMRRWAPIIMGLPLLAWFGGSGERQLNPTM